MLHRGEEVNRILKLKGVNITSLADQIKKTRQALYKQLKKADMSSHYINQIGIAIGYDFRKVIPNLEQDDSNNVVGSQTRSIQNVAAFDPVNFTIKLDGSEETLERLFVTLKALNDNIRSLNE